VSEPGIVRFFAYDARGEVNYDQGLPVIVEIEKRLNVKFEWEIMSYNSYEEALSIKLAAGSDMPDMFYSWLLNPDVLAMNNAIIPLSDYFDSYMSDAGAVVAANPDLRAQITSPDGKIYFLPDFYDKTRVNNGWLVRQDWMEKLNIPDPQTPEDVYQMLKAFKEQDPNGNGQRDEIPLNFAYLNYMWMMTYQWWGIQAIAPWNWMAIDGSRLYSYVTEPAFRDCIEWLSRCYADGLINQDVLNVVDADYTGAIYDNRAGLFFGGFSNMYTDNILLSHPDSGAELKIMMPPKAPGAKTTGIRVYGNTNGTYFISAAGKNPTDAMRVMNFVFGTDEGRFLQRAGIEGLTYILKNGDPYPTDDVLNPPAGKTSIDVLYDVGVDMVMASSFTPRLIAFSDALGGASQWILDGKKMLADNLDLSPEMSLRFTDEEVILTTEIHADIDTYITETLANIIVGKGTMADFDNMVAYVKDKGIDRIVAVYQAAYDRAN